MPKKTSALPTLFSSMLAPALMAHTKTSIDKTPLETALRHIQLLIPVQEAEAMRPNLTKTFGGKVRVYFKDFPLESIHPWARAASVTGRCIFRQNPQAFWKYHDWIYGVQGEITNENLNSKVLAWAPDNG